MFKIGDKLKVTIDLEYSDKYKITVKRGTIIDVIGTENVFDWETIDFIYNGHQLKLIPALDSLIYAVKVEQLEFKFDW